MGDDGRTGAARTNRPYEGRGLRAVLRGAAAAGALATLLSAAALPPASAAPHSDRVQRVSTAADGAQLTTASRLGAVSVGGRYVAFVTGCSGASVHCVHVKDLRNGAVREVPVSGPETHEVMISADGRRVAYTSGVYHFFKGRIHDRRTGEVQLLWPATPPTDARYEGGGITGFSADGDHVGYTIGNRHDGSRHLYVRDLATGADEMIDPLDHPGWITGGRLSANGRFVAYGTATNHQAALYVKDRATGETRRFDIAPDGTPSDGTSEVVDISADGRRVVFNSRATNLLPGEPLPAQYRAYVADLATGRIHQVGATPARAESADAGGRFVLLREDGGALVLHDLRTGGQRTVAAAEASAIAGPDAVARHGRQVVFTSSAADLVPDDTNGVSDVFVRHTR
ncbi:TolB family protein [Streptomyces aurantiogriseus]|uniref:Uncharacterized protein n=1 Tax=Streptomyces aurantiogriseus TaxID=66870 RepID=A0A918F7L8_9ACTN|nr:hypothetical protein [Streptomyces aurantiogriseus]GGR16477.1 hypothetical protein GCM10010251_35750 [Streptomyces aurantiogriseus]